MVHLGHFTVDAIALPGWLTRGVTAGPIRGRVVQLLLLVVMLMRKINSILFLRSEQLVIYIRIQIVHIADVHIYGI